MKLNELLNWIKTEIASTKFNYNIYIWYLLSIMISSKKHSLNFASTISGINSSQFSRFLQFSSGVLPITFENLSKKTSKIISNVLEPLDGGIWNIVIIVDSTLQKRSSLHPKNTQRFNHGKGFVIGHQWTNIILVINGIIIPLPPIAFYSRKYCKENKIEYKTEPEKLVKYLRALDLKQYIGNHNPRKVLFLADSGYDNKNIQKVVNEKKWSFIVDLKCSRSVKSTITPNSKWVNIVTFFRRQRCLSWKSIRIFKSHGTKRKRMDFRIRHAIVILRHCFEVQLVCSERKKRPDGRRKYLACNNLEASPRQIILGYRVRWLVEIFHKKIKMHLGFEDIATKSFNSVSNHVYCVYCAYLLSINISEELGLKKNAILEVQDYVTKIYRNKEFSNALQVMTQINGVEKHKKRIRSVLKNIKPVYSSLRTRLRGS